MPPVSFSQATGMALKNIASWLESTSCSTLRTQEFLRSESHKLTASVFTLTPRFGIISSSTICHSKSFLSLTLNKSTEFYTWQPPQNTLKSGVRLRQPVSSMRFKLISGVPWTKLLWKKPWLSLKIRELILFQPTWHCVRQHHPSLALTLAKFRSPNMSSLNLSATSVSIHFSFGTR